MQSFAGMAELRGGDSKTGQISKDPDVATSVAPASAMPISKLYSIRINKGPRPATEVFSIEH